MRHEDQQHTEDDTAVRQISSPAQSLRTMLNGPDLIRLVGAHDPLGALLAEQAGFDGVWASGLEMSASAGVPDADILTMSDLLSVASSLAAAVDIPVVADCDAGYGNVPNVMNMVRKYDAGGLAAVCIEDKRYPKRNSFVGVGADHLLLPTGEFCAKLVAATSARDPQGPVVMARIEALIAGLTVDQALDRAHAYAEAGADCLLIHDRGQSPDSILEFLSRWGGSRPVAVVPTTYHTIRARDLGDAGAAMVIYANHGLRARVAATRQAFAQILAADRTTEIEGELATLNDIFELQGIHSLLKEEKRCLAQGEAIAREFSSRSSGLTVA